MAYNLELLFAQVQSLYETAYALKKTTILDGDLLDDVEGKLQCLWGVQQGFTAANSALHQQVLRREQTEKAQQMATDFWKICTEVELILRTYVQKIKRHMGEQKPVGACQESVADTVKELIQEHNESIKVIADSVASAISHGQSGQSKAKLPLLQLPTVAKIHTNLMIKGIMKLHRPRRDKRGLINIGGDISKFLFGTMNQNDYDEIQSVMENFRNNSNTLIRKTNMQLSIVKSMLSELNRTEEAIDTAVLQVHD